MENKPIAKITNEVSLRELILLLKEYFGEVVGKWKWLIPFVLVPSLYMAYKALSTTPTYSATLTFTVNEDDTQRAGYSGILNDFGFGVGSGTEHNLDKILDLSKSMRIQQYVLFDTVRVNDTLNYIGNLLIEELNYEKKWKKKSKGLMGFRFIQDSLPAMSRKERRVIKSLYSDLIGNLNKEGFLKMNYSPSSGIMNMSIKTPSESLSISYVQSLFSQLSTYYIESTIEKQQIAFDQLVEKVDSIRTELLSKEAQLARFEDSNRNLLTRSAQLQKEKLQRDISLLSILYGEAVKNQETAEFTLKDKTPFIKTIDAPFAPLGRSKPNLYVNLIYGIIAGVFLWVCFVVSRKLYMDVMREEKDDD